MPLTKVSSARGWTRGEDLLTVCGETWLNSSSVLFLLEYFRDTYPSVGCISPDVAQVSADKRKSVMVAHGALDSSVEHVVSVVNLSGKHWTEFHACKSTRVCTLFDSTYSPVVSSIDPSNEEIVEIHDEEPIHAMKTFVEETIGNVLDIDLTFEIYVDMLQESDDSHSCGVFALLFLEIQLSGSSWISRYGDNMDYFRARYMKMAAKRLLSFSLETTQTTALNQILTKILVVQQRCRMIMRSHMPHVIE